MGTNAFFVEVANDTISPDFLPGDQLLIDPDKAPKPGGYVIAEFYKQRLCLQVVRGKKGQLRLKSPNDRRSVDAKHFKILGRVVQYR